jgi:hypothetical protein
MDIHEQYISQETDEEEEVHQTELTSNKKQKSKESSMANFLSSIGKKNSPSSSIIRSTTRSQFSEELMTYRSLADKEYHAIVVDEEKEYDVVSVIQLKLILFNTDFFDIIDAVLATTSITIKMLIENCL